MDLSPDTDGERALEGRHNLFSRNSLFETISEKHRARNFKFDQSNARFSFIEEAHWTYGSIVFHWHNVLVSSTTFDCRN